MPNSNPAKIEMIRNAMNGLNFAHVINNTSSKMQKMIIAIAMRYGLSLFFWKPNINKLLQGMRLINHLCSMYLK